MQSPLTHTYDNRNQISSILASRKFTPRNQSRASGFIAHQKLESWRAVCISPHFSNTPTSTNTHNMYKHPLYCCVCVCMWLTIMDIEIVGNLIYDMENKSWGALANWGANWIRSKPSRPNTTADIFWMSARIIIALTANKPARRCVESHFTRNQYAWRAATLGVKFAYKSQSNIIRYRSKIKKKLFSARQWR